MNITSKDIARMGFNEAPMRRSKFGNTHTLYDGIMYKSKLEARFAALMDFWKRAGIVREWMYEPQAMIFKRIDKHGKRKDIEYVPDFFVIFTQDNEKWFFECKGFVTQHDINKWEAFTENRPELFGAVFAQKLRIGKKGGISQFKYDKMHRICHRVWESINKEFKKAGVYEIGLF